MNDSEQDVRGQSWRALLLVYSSIQFVVLTTIAMFVYPGGAVYELEAPRLSLPPQFL